MLRAQQFPVRTGSTMLPSQSRGFWQRTHAHCNLSLRGHGCLSCLWSQVQAASGRESGGARPAATPLASRRSACRTTRAMSWPARWKMSLVASACARNARSAPARSRWRGTCFGTPPATYVAAILHGTHATRRRGGSRRRDALALSGWVACMLELMSLHKTQLVSSLFKRHIVGLRHLWAVWD